MLSFLDLRGALVLQIKIRSLELSYLDFQDCWGGLEKFLLQIKKMKR